MQTFQSPQQQQQLTQLPSPQHQQPHHQSQNHNPSQQQHQHQHQLQHPNQPAGSDMASFVARLMSLSAHELQLLHSDSELMHQLRETQMLLESRLQNSQLQEKLLQQHHHHQQYLLHQQLLLEQQQRQQQALYLDNYQQQYYQAQMVAQAALAYQQQQPVDLRTHSAGPVAWSVATSNHSSSTPASSSSAASSPAYLPAAVAVAGAAPSQQAPGANQLKRQRLDEHQKHFVNSQQQKPEAGEAERQQRRPVSGQLTVLADQTQRQPAAGAKKYKGEFDEPTAKEVAARQETLENLNDNYHRRLSLEPGPAGGEQRTKLRNCACVLGSVFQDKTVDGVLEMIEQWRHLPIEDRIKWKWDVTDLPKDIQLSDIKKFEDLRREASNGRADFGGASKRKPLGIRGTRQFLLILYCLWGHPGRDDVMQKEGYCPHCFAKIKKANEQSTLVRVVNHFNMKHRRGANPRLSPNREPAD